MTWETWCMAPRNMSSTTVSPVCPTDPSLAYYRRFWLALASLWLTVVSIAFVVISIKREVHLPLGPNLAKPQKLAKSTQGDSPTGLKHAPKLRFSCLTTRFASIPPLLRRELSRQCSQNFVVYPLGGLAGCLQDLCGCD
jgi:hypothetical protein